MKRLNFFYGCYDLSLWIMTYDYRKTLTHWIHIFKALVVQYNVVIIIIYNFEGIAAPWFAMDWCHYLENSSLYFTFWLGQFESRLSSVSWSDYRIFQVYEMFGPY